MRRLIPISAAVIVFLAALFIIRPEPTQAVVVAAGDLPAGRPITASDLALQEVPERLAPPDAFADIAALVGKPLRVDRSQGDIIRTQNLGEVVVLGPNERAVAVHVTDSGGLAGLIKPGDTVGVVASIEVQDPGAAGTFTKAAIEPLRVMYLSPDFQAGEAPTPAADSLSGIMAAQTRREEEGTVVLAVPTSAYVILYDFTGRQAANELRTVNALELLTALDAAGGARLSLYLVPANARAFASAGLFLPDLVITPVPTATPTATPEGYETPTPTPTPTATPTAAATAAP